MKIGTIINQYKIISQIGKGGMGEVFLAEDTKLDRKVALKILPAEFAEDADRMSRFVREAKSASALNHPNIITIYEIGESDGTHFIATEFIEGETLHEHLKGENISLKTVLEIAIQIASALQTAHSAGIVHRDIKPDNVMIRKDGLAKILDFGIAKLSGRGDAETPGQGEDVKTLIAVSALPHEPASTNPGMIIGTANYMSPEQAKGKEIDARSDVFSFGIVFYEMLTGRRAFEGETALESISSILKDEPKPISQILPEVPVEIDRIVNKTLKKDREERYQTAKDLLIDLKDAKQSLELQNLMERSIVPNRDENKTQIFRATTSDEINQTTTNQTVAGNSTKRYLAIGLLALLLAVGGFFGYKFLSPTTTHINSIAVLPFENRSGNADSEYLSDGLAESLIYRLSQLPDLKVSPTSSVFRYKGKEIDAKKVAEELKVDAVVTGRITQRGDSLNISIELVDVRNDRSLGGEQYERKMSELLTTQREIATEIVGKLQLRLSGESAQRLAKKFTDNNEAYQLYLRGQYHLARRSKEDLQKAVDYYQQAIKLDPNFAMAYVGMSYAYNTGTGNAFFGFSNEEGYAKARDAAVKAGEIDPNLAEAHTALGYAFRLGWKWSEAEREFKKALEIDPNNARTRYFYGLYLQSVGRSADSVREIKTAVELEPLALIMNANLAGAYLFDRQSELGLEQAKKTFDLDPNFVSARFWLAYAYCANKKYAEAIEMIEKGPQDESSQRLLVRFRAYAYAKSGRRSEAEAILAKYISDPAYDGANAAIIYGALGEKDKAFAALERGFARKEEMARMRLDPLFDDLRDDPRFADLLKRMGLTDLPN